MGRIGGMSGKDFLRSMGIDEDRGSSSGGSGGSFSRTCTQCHKSFAYGHHDNEEISEKEKMILVSSGATPKEFTNAIKIRCPHCGVAALIQAPDGFWL